MIDWSVIGCRKKTIDYRLLITPIQRLLVFGWTEPDSNSCEQRSKIKQKTKTKTRLCKLRIFRIIWLIWLNARVHDGRSQMVSWNIEKSREYFHPPQNDRNWNALTFTFSIAQVKKCKKNIEEYGIVLLRLRLFWLPAFQAITDYSRGFWVWKKNIFVSKTCLVGFREK